MRRQLLHDKALLHKLVGRFDDALTSLATWLEDHPNDIDFLWEMIAIYIIQEAYGDAYEMLGKAMKYKPVLDASQRKLAIEVTTRASMNKINTPEQATGSLGKLF